MSITNDYILPQLQETDTDLVDRIMTAITHCESLGHNPTPTHKDGFLLGRATIVSRICCEMLRSRAIARQKKE